MPLEDWVASYKALGDCLHLSVSQFYSYLEGLTPTSRLRDVYLGANRAKPNMTRAKIRLKNLSHPFLLEKNIYM
jgi:hypothetical protein